MKQLLLILLSLALAGCISINSDVVVADGETSDGITTINGDVNIGVASIVDGDVETVNGNIRLASGAQAGDVEAVNGKIEIGAEAVTKSVEGVNGPIEIGERAKVNGDVETVNGRITVGAEAVVSGKVGAINGQLLIRGARVGSLDNINGGMVLVTDTVVDGELRVRRARRSSNEDPVTIDIHDGVTVVGPLVFERPVTLRVHRGATLGEIEGAEPEYYSD
jgi:hypothetical protein